MQFANIDRELELGVIHVIQFGCFPDFETIPAIDLSCLFRLLVIKQLVEIKQIGIQFKTSIHIFH